MKISSIEAQRAEQITSVTPQSPVTKATPQTNAEHQAATPAAEVELSPQAQSLAAAKAAAAAAPETREDLVAQIKAKVDSGTYKVSSADIAEQMMNRARADRLQ